MKILAFDTSSAACTVALSQGANVDFLFNIAPMQQAKLILPMIHELLDASSLTLNQLDAIAYGCGPGSFTGIRIASSVAQGLGFAVGIPLIPVSSLAAIAQAAFIERQWTHLLVALDARMDQVYWANYQVNPLGYVELVGQEGVHTPDAVITMADTLSRNDMNWYGVGDGWEKYGDQLTQRLGFTPQAINAAQLPTAEAILKLAQIKFARREIVSASQALPAYLR